ncbi:hypothetical protein Tco_1068607 [Tanacetum coccineum]|uniref:Uncharacterized protein n=1 Tax=Tanacetum coccineum TaxID=301880 RepID=A0ABQ5HGQ2_9ASTR
MDQPPPPPPQPPIADNNTTMAATTQPPAPPPKLNTNNETPQLNPNLSQSPNPISYKFIPHEDEIMHALDRGGCDSVEFNKVSKRDVYSDHPWKVVADLDLVVYNSKEFMLQTKRYLVEGKVNELRRTIESGERETACCLIKNIDKEVCTAAAAERKASAALRSVKYATAMRLLESRELKVDKAASKEKKLKNTLAQVVGKSKTAESALKRLSPISPRITSIRCSTPRYLVEGRGTDSPRFASSKTSTKRCALLLASERKASAALRSVRNNYCPAVRLRQSREAKVNKASDKEKKLKGTLDKVAGELKAAEIALEKGYL